MFVSGNLKEEESAHILSNMEDPYEFEPTRHPALRPTSIKPFNAEPPLHFLADSFVTPS
jgi:sulfite oxidase